MENKSFKSFGISAEIVKALQSLRYYNPTLVQEEVIPLALEKKDILVESQTGSGKTAAYGIPICEQVIWEENKPQALILVPTRELALQIKADVMNIGPQSPDRKKAIWKKSTTVL